MSTLVAVIQLTCKSDKEKNFARAAGIIEAAARAGARIAFLPECFDMLCENWNETLQHSEPISGPLIQKYRDLAVRNKIWLSLGGFHEKVDGEEKVRNAHIILNDSGDIVSVYRKIHLCNLQIPGVVRLVESEFSAAGKCLVPPCQTPAGRVGLGICYDVRFPEMAIALARAGADILTYASAFAMATGIDHWQSLLRSRAIENQCYVIAAGQTGCHNSKRTTYGHSVIIDPWGAIIAQCSEGEGFALANINPSVLTAVRAKIPIWTDRRPDVYGQIISPVANDVSHLIDSVSNFSFGSLSVHSYQVFYKSNHTFAFIRHDEVIPGHVLIAPLRPSVKRLSDLNTNELTDFFTSVQRVQAVIESIHKTTSVAIHDAGHSADIFHAHILPQKSTDVGCLSQIFDHLRLQTEEIENVADVKGDNLQSQQEITAQSHRFRSCLQSVTA
jgi:predicted amidohydrolase/diadenosine tetraphosphate (Ap4A) HIT family hydrolase